MDTYTLHRKLMTMTAMSASHRYRSLACELHMKPILMRTRPGKMMSLVAAVTMMLLFIGPSQDRLPLVI